MGLEVDEEENSFLVSGQSIYQKIGGFKIFISDS
jgi:hypothetical protein